jgi:hypothetical protein
VPRHLLERHFPEGLEIPLSDADAALCRQVVANSAEEGVTGCIRTRKRTFYVYDDSAQETIRRAAARLDTVGPRSRHVIINI